MDQMYSAADKLNSMQAPMSVTSPINYYPTN